MGQIVIAVLGGVASVWGIANQFYTNKKRVDNDFNGNWRAYFKYLRNGKGSSRK